MKIELREDNGEYGVKSPTDVGTGKTKEEKPPLSEVIEVLNDRFGTNFTEGDRLFFEQIKEKAANTPEGSACGGPTLLTNSSWDCVRCWKI